MVNIRNTSILLLFLLVMSACSMVSAEGMPPWEWQDSVSQALYCQDGQVVLCEKAAVSKIEARNNPAYFVISDQFNPKTRLIVLCRVPAELEQGQIASVQGTLGTLASGERCLTDVTVYGYFNMDGSMINWSFYLPFWANKQALIQPASPIPSSDPSMPSGGRAGAVTGEPREKPAVYESAASLLDSEPDVLTLVELSCRPVREAGAGYIVVGDDGSESRIKVYTKAFVSPADRIIKLTGTIHSELGGIVIYADDGPEPYFDPQGYIGSVFAAKPGTVAYASTLGSAKPSGMRAMGFISPETANGSWVYLTGQVVTYIGSYWTYDIPETGGWISVYNIQGLDRTPGIRAWSPAYGPNSVGSVVDVMAKVDTKDGQRMLGIWSADSYDAVDLDSSSHSLEAIVLADGGYSNPLNVLPVGIVNRNLCGGTMGNNPGVTGGHGLYNVGSYVTVWGKALESGTYQFDQYGWHTQPYIRIDDGSGVASGNSTPSYGGPYGNQGVMVLGTNSFGWYSSVEVGDYVSVTGVCSLWKPNGSNDTYRCIWTSNSAVNQVDPQQQSTREVIGYGTISGTVKLYDMPEATATVRLYSTCGRNKTLEISRGGDNSGSTTFSWSDIPKTVLIGGYNYDYPQYIVSAKCDGYKTRTYTQVTPWAGTETPRNLYLTRLRKIYVTTNDTNIGSCGGDSTVITATVVDSDRNPIQGVTVRFRANKGSFSSGSIVREYTPGSTTNAQGQVTATLYGMPSEWGSGVVVEATDDSAPLAGDDPEDDTYKYDWQQLHDNYGQPINITINQPSVSFELAANPTLISRCGGDMSAITATVTVCGSGESGVVVTFSTNRGVFDETGTTSATATTNENGVATVHLKASTDGEGTATIIANANVYGIYLYTYTPVDVVIGHDMLTLAANPFSVPPSQSTSTITAKLATPLGVGISGKQITFTTTAGTLNPTSGTTNANGEVSTTLSGVSQGEFAVVEATSTNRCNETIKQRCQVDYLQTAADDWPMFMRDNRHQGYARTYDNAYISSFGEPVWTQPINTATTSRYNWTLISEHPNPARAFLSSKTYTFEHPYIDSSPVHATDCPVIVGAWVGDFGSYLESSTGYLAAFNPATGNLQWDYPAGARDNDSLRLPGGISSTPAIATVGGQKRVFVGCMDGKVYCLNADTGTLIWSFQTKKRDNTTAAKLIQSPVVCDGVVYIGNESARVYALNAADGTSVWTSPYDVPASDLEPDKVDITGVSSIAVATIGGQARLYFGCDSGSMYCLNASTKDKVWSYRPEYYGCIESSPTIYAGNVYFGITFFEGTNIFALNGSTGDLLWKRRLIPPGLPTGGEEIRATCAAMDNAVYVGEDTGHYFYRLNAQTGATEPDLFPPNPFNAGDFGKNYFVGSAALTSAGYVVVGNDNGTLYALDKDDVSYAAPSSVYDTSIGSIQFNNYICSSPAISYAVQSNYKWIYVVSRADNGRHDGKGTLFAFRQDKN